MTVQTILRFPDHHLRATAQRVVVFDEDLCSLATDLLDTLRAASAIGIGVLKRLAVIDGGWSADLRQPADHLDFRRHDPA